jgi:leucyl-tRNA synthetase
VDDTALVQDEIELVLQINGKHRGSVRCPRGQQAGDREAGVASEDFASTRRRAPRR